MDFKVPKLKSFSQFVSETIYVVELRATGFCKAFLTEKEAIEYWELKEKAECEPKMRRYNIKDISTILTEEQFTDFKKRYSDFFDEMGKFING